ncbi:MAG: hypothetical protein IKP00_04140 [Victivallales bacterium]|nr:hypothetical protein [Victivallales bacterium]
MKDRGAPISLFSFQDIVTSLTGIMVIVILVIVLQLAEARFDYENPKSDNSEYLEMKAKMKELAEQLKQLKEAGEEIPEEVKAYLNISVEAVDAQLQDAEKATAAMTAEKERNEKEMVTMKLTLGQLKELLKGLNAEKKEKEAKRDVVDEKVAAAEKDDSSNTLERQLQTLQLENERLKNNIRITADKVEFSFVGIMSRQPILIECTGNGFRAQVYKSGQPVKEFRGGGLSSSISGLVAWLRQQDLKKSYPVLLLRRSFFSHLDDLLITLYRLDKDIVLGMEPLDDKVKVF